MFRFRSRDSHDPEVEEQDDPGAGRRVREHRGPGYRAAGHVLRAAGSVRARGPGNRAGRQPGGRRVQPVRRPVSSRVPDDGRGGRPRGRRRVATRRRLRPVSRRQGVRRPAVRRRAVHAGEGHLPHVRRHQRARARAQVRTDDATPFISAAHRSGLCCGRWVKGGT